MRLCEETGLSNSLEPEGKNFSDVIQALFFFFTDRIKTENDVRGGLGKRVQVLFPICIIAVSTQVNRNIGRELFVIIGRPFRVRAPQR